MTDRDDLERRVEEVAADAAAALQLAVAVDRDLADLGVKVDANRAAINALGVQTAAGFERVWRKFDQVDARFDRLENEVRTGFAQMHAGFAEVHAGFAEMRAKFDQTAAGHDRIVGLITDLMRRDRD